MPICMFEQAGLLTQRTVTVHGITLTRCSTAAVGHMRHRNCTLPHANFLYFDAKASYHMTESMIILQVNGRDTQLYEQAGLLTQQTVMAHGVTLTDAELQLLAKRGTAIAHCPLSNFYFADVPLDVLRCLKAGVKVWHFLVNPAHYSIMAFRSLEYLPYLSSLLLKRITHLQSMFPSPKQLAVWIVALLCTSAAAL